MAAEAIKRGLFGAMAAVYPARPNDPTTWPICRRLDVHADALLAGRAEDQYAAFDTRLATFLVQVGQYRQWSLAAYRSVRPMFERALAIREKALGAEHPDSASSLNNLAILLRDQGDLAAARRRHPAHQARRHGGRGVEPGPAGGLARPAASAAGGAQRPDPGGGAGPLPAVARHGSAAGGGLVGHIVQGLPTTLAVLLTEQPVHPPKFGRYCTASAPFRHWRRQPHV